MALHDVDKSSNDRSSPLPNSKDTLDVVQRPAHGTTSINYFTDSSYSDVGDVLSGIGHLVKKLTGSFTSNGASITTGSMAHNLGYVPYAISAIENATVTGITSPVSVFLPTFLSASVGGVAAGAVTFGVYISHYVNDTHVWFIIQNASGTTVTVNVTVYLYEQRAG